MNERRAMHNCPALPAVSGCRYSSPPAPDVLQKNATVAVFRVEFVTMQDGLWISSIPIGKLKAFCKLTGANPPRFPIRHDNAPRRVRFAHTAGRLDASRTAGMIRAVRNVRDFSTRPGFPGALCARRTASEISPEFSWLRARRSTMSLAVADIVAAASVATPSRSPLPSR